MSNFQYRNRKGIKFKGNPLPIVGFLQFPGGGIVDQAVAGQTGGDKGGAPNPVRAGLRPMGGALPVGKVITPETQRGDEGP